MCGEQVPDLDEEVSLKDYLDVLLRRKWLVLGFLLLTFVTTAVFTFSATRIYKATATLEVHRGEAKVTKFEEVVESELRSQEFMQTQVGLLESKTLAKRVAEKLDMPKRLEALRKSLGQDEGPGLVGMAKTAVKDAVFWVLEWFQPGGEDSTGERATYKIALPEDVLEEKEILGFMQGNLTVEPRRNAMIIELSFTSPDRYLSLDVVRTYAEQFVAWQMDKKLDASRIAREFLMKQISRAQIELERSEDELNRFAKQSGIVSLEGNLNSVYVQLEEINRSLAEAEAEFIKIESQYRQAVEEGPAACPR